MSDIPESYWRPQIIKHTKENGVEEFAIHEVYFLKFGKTWGPTADALSHRCSTVEQLQNILEKFMESDSSSMKCGDKNYEYFKEDVSLWLEHIGDPVLDYPNE